MTDTRVADNDARRRDEALESLSSRLRDVQMQLTLLKAQEVTLKNRVEEILDGKLGTIEAFGKAVFKVERQRRFDSDTAAAFLQGKGIDPVVLGITRAVIDRELAQATLAPALYEQCKKASPNPTIRPA